MMRVFATTVLAAALAAPPAHAQLPLAQSQPPDGALILHPFAGAFVPVGAQRELLATAVIVGLEWSWRITSGVAITGRLGWSPTRDLLVAGNPALDAFHYDIGGEARGEGWMEGEGWEITPFAGLGGGARTYVYRALAFRATTNLAAYGAAGADIGFGRVGFRIEGRHYFSQLEPLFGQGVHTTRNDLALSAGLWVRS
jgi:hypothetical protein